MMKVLVALQLVLFRSGQVLAVKPDVMLIGHGLVGGLYCHCWASASYTELVHIVNGRV